VTQVAPVTRRAQVGVDLLVQHCPTSRDVYVATGEGLNDVQLVQHVIDAAVVREPVESRANRFLGCHRIRLLVSMATRLERCLTTACGRQPPVAS